MLAFLPLLLVAASAPPPVPVACPPATTCTFRPSLVPHGALLTADSTGIVRPIHAALLMLIRLDEGRWVPEPFDGREAVITRDAGRTASDLAGHPLSPGLFFAALSANGRLECAELLVGSVVCQDIWIGRPPAGFVAACVPSERSARAMFVPDPAALVPGCDRAGWLARTAPASGEGVATDFLEDGRVLARTPLHRGLPEGVRTTLASPYDGSPERVETAFVAGRRHGPERRFDADGRLVVETGWADDLRDGAQRLLAPSGRLAEEWIWSRGRLQNVRVLAGDGRVLARQRWDPPGAGHGTFCRPDRRCSQW